MAHVPSKGTVLKQSIAGAALSAVAQLTEVSYSGGESETYDTTVLNQVYPVGHASAGSAMAGKTLGMTGYSESGEVSLGGFYDPALAGHQAISDLVTTPAECNWSITFAQSPTDDSYQELVFTSAGVSWEVTASMSDGLKFSSTLKVTGSPTYPT